MKCVILFNMKLLEKYKKRKVKKNIYILYILYMYNIYHLELNLFFLIALIVFNNRIKFFKAVSYNLSNTRKLIYIYLN